MESFEPTSGYLCDFEESDRVMSSQVVGTSRCLNKNVLIYFIWRGGMSILRKSDGVLLFINLNNIQ